MSYALPFRRGPFLGCLALALLLGIGAPQGWAADDKKNDQPAEESVLRTYDTPPGMALAVVRMLQKIYPPSASVRIAENGDSSLVVYGPSSVQAAAARFVRAAQPGNTKPPRTDERPLPVSPRNDKKGKKGSSDKPLTITAVGNRLILTCDDPDALAEAQKLIQLLMKVPEGAGDFEIIPLRNATAEDAVKVIDEAFNGKSAQAQPQQQGFGGFFARMRQQQQQPETKKEAKVRVVADPNSNSLIVWASPLDLVSVRRLVEALDSGKTESVAIVRKWVIGPLKYASAYDVEWVVRDLYREQMNENPRAAADTGGGFGRFRGPGRFQNRNVDAAGNPRRVSVSTSVDDRTNTLYVASPEAIYKEIKDLAERMEKQAEKSRRTVRIEPLVGIDAYLVQQAVDAIMGHVSRPNSRSQQTNFGGPGGGFGGPGGGFGGPGGGFGGFPGGFGGPGGGQRGGGQRGMGNTGTGGQGRRQP